MARQGDRHHRARTPAAIDYKLRHLRFFPTNPARLCPISGAEGGTTPAAQTRLNRRVFLCPVIMARKGSAAYYASSHWRDLRRLCLERDRWRCTVPGCHDRAVIADHIQRRTDSPDPTPLDALSNLRSLCRLHDGQVKETARGDRAMRGAFRVIGCDAAGWPLDPSRT